MRPDRERELLEANNRYLERARTAEAELAAARSSAQFTVDAVAVSVADMVHEWYDGGPVLTTHIPVELIARRIARFVDQSAAVSADELPR